MVRTGGFALVFLGMVTAGGLAQAAQSAAAGKAGNPAPAAPASPPAQAPARSMEGGSNNGAASTAATSQDAAARARMHECGHQWSTIKKAGNAGTMTWKEFSATCLVSR